MFGLFKKEKWALVHTIKHRNAFTFYFHLFESEKGSRRIEYVRDGQPYSMDRDYSRLKDSDIYQEKVYRWLNGRRDPEIPTYSQIGEDDTSNFLKGKI